MHSSLATKIDARKEQISQLSFELIMNSVEYRWGPATDRVFLLKRQKQIESGKDYGWKTQKRDSLPSKEVWKYTVAPDR